LLESDMGNAVRAVYPDYDGGFNLGLATEPVNTFTWTGVHWTTDLILARFTFIGFAVLLTLLGALFFDRFDPSRRKPRQTKRAAASPDLQPATPSHVLPAVNLTPLNTASNRFSFFNILNAELKLLLKGQRWWWYLIAGGLIIAGFVNTSTITREAILPITWVWPVLIWSAIGNREIRHNVQQMTFSSPYPTWRQIPAQWLAGFILTIAMSTGAILRLGIEGDATGLLVLLTGAIFIPSLALASGVWSGGSKLFEILYILIWYIGPLNRTPALDYIGATANGNPKFFLLVSILLVTFAIFGRTRQVRT